MRNQLITVFLIAFISLAVTPQNTQTSAPQDGGTPIVVDTCSDLLNETWATPPGWTEFGTGSTENTGEAVVPQNAAPAGYYNAFTLQTSEAWAEYNFSFDSGYTMPASQIVEGPGIYKTSHFPEILNLGLRHSTVLKWFVRQKLNSGTSGITISDATHTPVPDTVYKITLHWKAESAPSANDGIYQVWVDTTLIHEALTADNDGFDTDTFVAGSGSVSATANVTYRIDNVKVCTTGQAPS